MKFETHTLDNGMRVIIAPNDSTDTVTVMAMTTIGSRYESEELNGMAHFLEHTLFHGTKNRKDARTVNGAIDGIGGEINAFTGQNETAYYAKVPKRHFETAFDVISDIFLNPLIPAKKIETERGAIIAEIDMYEDTPPRLVYNMFDKLLFGKHPLGRDILGPKENVNRFQRKEFLNFFNTNYVAANSAICIAGNVSSAKALRLAKKTFKDMRIGDAPVAEPYTHEQNEPRIHVRTKPIDQTHFFLGTIGYEFDHKHEAALEVLSALLGGGMSARMFTEVREKRGLAYYIKTGMDSFRDTGTFYVRAGVTNEKQVDAITIILKELKKVTKTLVKDDELTKAKEYVKGNAALRLDQTDTQAHFIGSQVLLRGTNKGLDAFNRKIDKVTAADVRTVARDLFKTENLNLAVVGPKSDEKELMKLLKL